MNDTTLPTTMTPREIVQGEPDQVNCLEWQFTPANDRPWMAGLE